MPNYFRRALLVALAVVCMLLGYFLTTALAAWSSCTDGTCSVAQFLVEIGPNISASGIVPLIFLAYTEFESWLQKEREDALHRAAEQARDAATSLAASTTERLELILGITESFNAAGRLGIVGGSEKRGQIARRYLELHQQASLHVELLGTDLRAVTSNFTEYADSLREGVRYRILLLDPDYPSQRNSYARYRARDEGGSEPVAVAEIRQYCRAFARWRTENPDRKLDYSIRLYRALPNLHYARFDDRCFYGPYMVDRSGSDTFVTEIKSPSPMFSQLTTHFDALWSSRHSVPVPAAWFA